MVDEKKINLLYVEDDEADVDFVQTALRQTNCRGFSIHVVADGEEALKFFGRDEKFKHMPMPQIVLLDLNLPKIGGKELLRRLKATENLKRIPVVILSTSSVERDVNEAYALGASGYVTKPDNFDGYKEVMKQMHDYWTEVCELPLEGTKPFEMPGN